MRVNDGFRGLVLEQLPGVESVRLYLKVDDSTRGQYEADLVASSQPPAISFVS